MKVVNPFYTVIVEYKVGKQTRQFAKSFTTEKTYKHFTDVEFLKFKNVLNFTVLRCNAFITSSNK